MQEQQRWTLTAGNHENIGVTRQDPILSKPFEHSTSLKFHARESWIS
jgi:hypothetical protein